MSAKHDDPSDPAGAPATPAPQGALDEDREAILARRNRFVRAALGGLAGASIVAACGGDVDSEPQKPSPTACLSMTIDGGAPQPCLGMLPPDSSTGDARNDSEADADADTSDAAPDAGPTDATTDDAAPMPCLSPPPPDSGND